MPRVAMVLQRYLPHLGGAERQVQGLAPLLRKRGYDIVVLTRGERGLAAFEVIDGTPIYRLPAAGPKPVAALSFLITAVRLLGRLDVDIIHAHELLSPASIAMLGKLVYGSPVAAKVLRGGQRGDLHKIKAGGLGHLRLWILRQMVDVFIAISSEIQLELARAGIPRESCTLIPNGVNIDRFRPASAADRQKARETYGLPHDALIVVYTGRLVPEKRVDHLVTAWPAVRAAVPDAILLIAGGGPDEARLRRMAGQGVICVGEVQDIVPCLQCADMFALPSVTEGLSGALLEALASGLPVIATSVGGAPDVIQHLKSGYLIPPEDVEALAHALCALLKDPSLRARLGENGRQQVVSAFSLDLTADRLADTYRVLLNSTRLTG